MILLDTHGGLKCFKLNVGMKNSEKGGTTIHPGSVYVVGVHQSARSVVAPQKQKVQPVHPGVYFKTNTISILYRTVA